MDKDQDKDSSRYGIRRGHRNRIPNPIYKEGIKQLKRSFNRNGKVREEDSGLDEDAEQSFAMSAQSDETQWMKCTIQDEQGSQKPILVSIRLSKPQGYLRKESLVRRTTTKTKPDEPKMDEENFQSKKMRKKSTMPVEEPTVVSPTTGYGGLYQLMLNVAQKVLETPLVQPPGGPRTNSDSSQSQGVTTVPKKHSKEERQGKLLSVTINPHQIVFQHSKLGQIQVDMKTDMVSQVPPEVVTHLSNGMSIEDITKAFEHHKNSIYRSSIFI